MGIILLLMTIIICVTVYECIKITQVPDEDYWERKIRELKDKIDNLIKKQM